MTEREFREKVMPLQRMMYAISLRAGIPPDEAADTVQESLLRLWRHRGRIPAPPGELKAYCLTAHRNECISWLKGAAPRGELLEEAVSLAAEPRRDDAEYRDTRSRIEQIIDTLPEGQRTVIRMSSFSGLDNSEIARITGQSDNNVRQLLSRGRRRLRELLSKVE